MSWLSGCAVAIVGGERSMSVGSKVAVAGAGEVREDGVWKRLGE